MTTFEPVDEGQLKIVWEPDGQYRVDFVTSRGQQGERPGSRYITSAEGLKSYLKERGLQDEDVDKWILKLHEEKKISIPNAVLGVEPRKDNR